MRIRRWIIAGAVFVVVVTAVLLALPSILRWAIERQVQGMTGERVAVGDVDLNVFTRRLAIVDARVGDETLGPPLARFDRLDARFALLPLVRAHVELLDVTLAEPIVHVVRRRDGTLNIAPALERLGARAAGPAAFDVTIEHGTVRGGAVVLEDRAVQPARTWRATDIALTADEVSTRSDASAGTAVATLDVAGAPARITAEDIRLRPLHVRAELGVTGLDVAPASIYMRDAPVTLRAGRFTATSRVAYDTSSGVRGEGRATIEGFVLAGQDEGAPRVEAPSVELRSRDVVYRDGEVAAGRLELHAQPTVVDPRDDEVVRLQLSALDVAIEDARHPARAPARVSIHAELPAGGRLDASGDATVFPVTANLDVAVDRLDVRLASRYVPDAAPISPTQGRLSADVELRYAMETGLSAGGALTFRDLALLRRGQTVPFIHHPELRTRFTGLRVDDGTIAVARLTMSGTPTIVDASVSPPQRFRVTALSLTVEDAAWPSRAPARVRGAARLASGASARLSGRLSVDPLAVDVELAARDVALARLRAYLPGDAPVTVERGQLDAKVRLVHDPSSGVRISGTGTVERFALARRGDAEALVEAAALALRLDGLRVRDGDVTVGRAAVEGAPVLHARGQSVAVRGLTASVRDVAPASGRPARAELDVQLPNAGRLSAQGTIELAQRTFAADVEIDGAALRPYSSFVPLSAPITGTLTATLETRGDFGNGARVTVTGQALARDLSLGPPDQAPITVSAIELAGLDAAWPGVVRLDRLVIREPSALIAREADGSFPLVAMLRSPDGDSPAASPGAGARPARDTADDRATRLPFEAGEIVLAAGDVRFIDRTTRPFYSEEITDLHVTVRGLTSDKGARADVEAQGILGATAALELDGVVAPFGKPFFLEVAGALRQFDVPRTNPYLRRLFDAIATRGELTTKLHYRVVGEQLQGTNEIVVQQLDVEPGRDGEVGRVIGLPLALVVSLLKNPSGDIRLTIPVEGALGSPKFGFGDAILTAVRNTVARLVTSPLRAIGRLFRRDGEIVRAEVDPVTFEPADTVIRADAAKQVQRVADFLRAAPYVGLAFHGVVTGDDLAALRARAVTSDIQRVQREAGIETFAAAAMHLFHERYPDRAIPGDVREIVQALAEERQVPQAELADLARRRAAAVRQILIDDAGIDPSRLVAREPETAARREPRVEFELLPSG